MIRYLFSILFLFAGIAGFSQTSVQTSKYVFVKFDTYSVKEDQLVQSELSNEKIIYTCIPSGILVIEVFATDTAAEKRIAGEIKKITGLPSFSFAKEMTLTDAENSCSTFRKPD